MTVYVLFSQQRSGSTPLASFISSHAQVRNLTEILNPYNTENEDNFFCYWLNNDPAAMIRARRSPSEAFVEYLNQLEEKYKGQNLLLDIKLNNIRHVLNYWEELPGFTGAQMPWLIHFFKLRKSPVVFMNRENHFQRFVSSKAAELTGVYHSNDPSARGKVQMSINLEQMMDFIVKAEAAEACFTRFLDQFERSLRLTYEECFVKSKLRLEIKAEVAQFFGFDLQVNAEPYYVQQKMDKLDKVILNFKEVCAELRNSGRERYITAA